MGTELVPFEDWSQFETWHRNMRRKSKKLRANMGTLRIISIVGMLVCSLVLGWIWAPLGVTVLLSAIGVFFYERLFGDKAQTRNTLTSLPLTATLFPCPHCYENINLSHAWTCGWCKEPHDDWWVEAEELRTPVQGCANSECEKTGLHSLSYGFGDQAALQCPHCQRHIVLDPVLYQQRQCHLSPYRGVARTTGDAREPTHPAPIRSVFPTPAGSPEPEKSDRRKSRLDDI